MVPARAGDFQNDSDIDILILLNVPLGGYQFLERNRILDISDKLDLEYDVVLAPVVQNYELYQKYIPVSSFYQNVEREGVKIALSTVPYKKIMRYIE